MIFTIKEALTGGSLATQSFARGMGKPCLHVSREGQGDPVRRLVQFLEGFEVRILNIAGPRASGAPGVGEFIWEVLDGVLVAG